MLASREIILGSKNINTFFEIEHMELLIRDEMRRKTFMYKSRLVRYGSGPIDLGSVRSNQVYNICSQLQKTRQVTSNSRYSSCILNKFQLFVLRVHKNYIFITIT